MALNPVAFTEKIVANFLRYQITAYPFADARLHAQMRNLLSLEQTRRTPLLQGPYVSLSRSFRSGATVKALVDDGVLHPHVANLAAYPSVYGHQEQAIRSIRGGKTTLVSTGTGSGKTECFLYPIISRCLELRDAQAPAGIVAVIVYPMNALAEDQLLRLRDLLAGTGITVGMYVGKTPEKNADVAGQRLRPGASREDYRAELARAQQEKRKTAVHPAEERCSREEMRADGQQPRILLTNVKQLELLLTRQKDAELFTGARLEYLVFDEAHTFTGTVGAESACLVRRLRAFCGRSAEETVCIATSATIADPSGDPDAGRKFAARFFGVAAQGVTLVGEEYEEDVWGENRRVPLAPESPSDALAAVLRAVDVPDDGTFNAVCAEVAEAYHGLCRETVPAEGWSAALYDRLANNAVVHALAQELAKPRRIEELPAAATKRVGRSVSEEEILAWLTLGAAAKKNGRALLRPVVHAFVRGIDGAVVSFPAGQNEPRLWLSAADESLDSGEGPSMRLPVTSCSTCGQHYYVHFLKDLDFTGPKPGGGDAVEKRSFWPALDRSHGGKRIVLLDRLVSAEDDDDPDDAPGRTVALYFCRLCGAGHPESRDLCDGCGSSGESDLPEITLSTE